MQGKDHQKHMVHSPVRFGKDNTYMVYNLFRLSKGIAYGSRSVRTRMIHNHVGLSKDNTYHSQPSEVKEIKYRFKCALFILSEYTQV